MSRKFDERIYRFAEILDNRNAEDIILIDIQGQSILADYFVICSGKAANHVKVLADELEDKLSKEGIRPVRQEGYQEGRWIVMDYGDVLVHIFHSDEREYYNIERLWKAVDNFENYIPPQKN